MKQKITDLIQQNEYPSHHQIYLNKKPFLVIPTMLIENLGLRVGLEIEPQAIEKLIAADEVMRAKKYALKLMQDEIYSKSQMTRLLLHEGYTDKTVGIIINELIHSGHIRDRLFAEKWIQKRQKTNPKGGILLKQELIDRGVDIETAEQVLSEVKHEEEKKLALKIAQKRAKQYRRLPKHIAKRRLYGFLARRGFDADTIIQVITEVL